MEPPDSLQIQTLSTSRLCHHDVAQASIKLTAIVLPLPLEYRITDVSHCTPLSIFMHDNQGVCVCVYVCVCVCVCVCRLDPACVQCR